MNQLIEPGGVDRIPDYDPRSGEHYWTMFAVYRISPETMGTDGPVLLDRENLVHLGSRGCFHCEQAYSPRLLHRRCPGQPRE